MAYYSIGYVGVNGDDRISAYAEASDPIEAVALFNRTCERGQPIIRRGNPGWLCGSSTAVVRECSRPTTVWGEPLNDGDILRAVPPVSHRELQVAIDVADRE